MCGIPGGQDKPTGDLGSFLGFLGVSAALHGAAFALVSAEAASPHTTSPCIRSSFHLLMCKNLKSIRKDI